MNNLKNLSVEELKAEQEGLEKVKKLRKMFEMTYDDIDLKCKNIQKELSKRFLEI